MKIIEEIKMALIILAIAAIVASVGAGAILFDCIVEVMK